MREKILLLIFFMLISNGTAISQDFIQESIGKTNKEIEEANPEDSLFIPLNNWIGEKVIFLPKSKSLQRYGYKIYNSKKDLYRDPISYDILVGKIATIKSIDQNNEKGIITFELSNGEKYYTAIFGNTVDDVVLLNDLKVARDKFLGKTIWYTGGSRYHGSSRILMTYNEETGKLKEEIFVSSVEPLKVINVVASWDHTRPIRFVMETKDGNIGFVDINFTGNNTSPTLRHRSRFNDTFSTVNPKQVYDWSKEIWATIEQSEPVIGMNKHQLIMAISTPKEINATRVEKGKQEQWIYDNRAFKGYIYFENGQLSGIQD